VARLTFGVRRGSYRDAASTATR